MKPTTKAQRRKFLLAAGLGGAGVAAVLVSGRKAKIAAKQAAAAAGDEQRTAYRETAHVQKYYKTTEV